MWRYERNINVVPATKTYIYSIARAAGANEENLRISYVIQLLYFALLQQSHTKYFHHEETVNVYSLKIGNISRWIQRLAAHRFQKGQCVLSNPVRFHANETNVQAIKGGIAPNARAHEHSLFEASPDKNMYR